MSPRPDVSELRRTQILEAAMSVFARLGFHKARMDDIAQEAGLSKGALYWYYKSKDAIIAAILDRILSWELRHLEAVRTMEGSTRERLLELTHRVTMEVQRLSFLMPVAYEFYAVAARQNSVREAFREYFRTYRELLASLIQEGVERGEFRAVDPTQLAITLIALHEGLVLLWIVDPRVIDLATMSEISVRQVLDGMEPEK